MEITSKPRNRANSLFFSLLPGNAGGDGSDQDCVLSQLLWPSLRGHLVRASMCKQARADPACTGFCFDLNPIRGPVTSFTLESLERSRSRVPACVAQIEYRPARALHHQNIL